MALAWWLVPCLPFPGLPHIYFLFTAQIRIFHVCRNEIFRNRYLSFYWKKWFYIWIMALAWWLVPCLPFPGLPHIYFLFTAQLTIFHVCRNENFRNRYLSFYWKKWFYIWYMALAWWLIPCLPFPGLPHIYFLFTARLRIFHVCRSEIFRNRYLSFYWKKWFYIWIMALAWWLVPCFPFPGLPHIYFLFTARLRIFHVCRNENFCNRYLSFYWKKWFYIWIMALAWWLVPCFPFPGLPHIHFLFTARLTIFHVWRNENFRYRYLSFYWKKWFYIWYMALAWWLVPCLPFPGLPHIYFLFTARLRIFHVCRNEIFRNRYLSFYWKKWFYIWYMALAWWLVPCLPFPGLPHIYFLFTARLRIFHVCRSEIFRNRYLSFYWKKWFYIWIMALAWWLVPCFPFPGLPHIYFLFTARLRIFHVCRNENFCNRYLSFYWKKWFYIWIMALAWWLVPCFPFPGLPHIYFLFTARLTIFHVWRNENFRNRYLSFYWKKWFYIWYMALAWWLVPCLPFPGLPHIYFLFTARLRIFHVCRNEIFRNRYLSFYWKKWFYIWIMALAWWLVPCFPFPGLPHIYFLFTAPLRIFHVCRNENFCNRYLSFYWKKWFYIWYMALAWWLVPCLPFPGLPHIYFLFTAQIRIFHVCRNEIFRNRYLSFYWKKWFYIWIMALAWWLVPCLPQVSAHLLPVYRATYNFSCLP